MREDRVSWRGGGLIPHCGWDAVVVSVAAAARGRKLWWRRFAGAGGRGWKTAGLMGQVGKHHRGPGPGVAKVWTLSGLRYVALKALLKKKQSYS